MSRLTFHLVSSEIVRTDGHRQHVGTQLIKRNATIGLASCHDAKIVVTRSILARGIIAKIFPVKTPAQRRVSPPVFERRGDGVQILAIVEFRFLDELPIVRLFGGLRARERAENSRSAERVYVDVDHAGVCRGKVAD